MSDVTFYTHIVLQGNKGYRIERNLHRFVDKNWLDEFGIHGIIFMMSSLYNRIYLPAAMFY